MMVCSMTRSKVKATIPLNLAIQLFSKAVDELPVNLIGLINV